MANHFKKICIFESKIKPMENIFTIPISTKTIARIENLSAASTPKWGKMNIAQMLAHCNVTYEMALEDIHPKPGMFAKFMMKLFVKNIVVSDKPYTHNSRTADEFIIADSRDFEKEKNRLINYISTVQTMGEGHFEGKDSHAFGPLTSKEWNNMFMKHLDHHLTQFGV